MLSKFAVRAAATAASVLALSVPVHAESIKEALTSAYTNNPQLASALLSVKSAAEDIALRKAGKRPTISASADLGTSWTLTNGVQTSSASSSIGLSYSQVLFDNLKTEASIEQARALSVVASEGLRNAEQNVLLQAVTAYVNVLRDDRLVRLRQENVSFYQAQVESAKSRRQIGEGTSIDVSQAEASYAQAIASYKASISSLRISQASYARWIGHAPRNLSLSYSFGGLLPNSLESALSLADRFHPAILSSKASIRASQAGSDSARAAFGPTLSLIGSIGGSFSQSSATGSAQAITGSVRLSLSIPLYAGGALGASLRKANIAQIKSEIDALDTRNQVRESVISAWAGMQNAIAQIESAKAAVRASQLSLEGVIEQQRVGQLTTLDVLNARTSLTGVQEALVGSETSRVIASFSLIAAAGQLSARELGLPVTFRSGQGYIRKVEDVWSELRAIAE